jgi:oligosaccharide repeat unit polymerase
MNIATLFDVIDWPVFLLIYLGVLGFAIVLFRRCAYGLYDPAWIVIAALAVAVTLVAYLYQVERIGTVAQVLYMALTLLGFLLGIRATRTVMGKIRSRAPTIDFRQPRVRREMLQLRRLLGFLQIMILALVAVRAVTQGLPILAVDPELAKVEVNSAGFGLITRLTSPAVTMSLSITFLLAAKGMLTRRQSLLALLPPVIALLASGSKGGLIAVLVSFTAVQAYLMGLDAQYSPPRAGRVLILAAAAIFGYALFVLLLRAAGAGEGDPLLFAFTTFGVRLIAFGDGVFYFFPNELYRVLSFQPLDYVWDNLLAPVFAMLRLIDYPTSLGLKISGEMFGQDKLGPNPTVFVEGFAYFGAVWGPVYAACIGSLFQILRSNTFSSSTQFRVWQFLWFAMLFPMAQVITADTLLFVAELINTLLVAALVWVVHAIYRLPRPHRTVPALA